MRLVVVAVVLGVVVAGGAWWVLAAMGEALRDSIPVFRFLPG
ncbi:hypothetical protein ACFY19_10140 [Streptosporangium saharense]